MTQPKWTDLFGIDPDFKMAPNDYEQGRLAGLAEAAALIEAARTEWDAERDWCTPDRLATVLAVLKSGGVA